MKTNVPYIYDYLAEVALESETFLVTSVQELKTRILRSITFYPNIMPFMR
jgi:hypothetical protein